MAPDETLGNFNALAFSGERDRSEMERWRLERMYTMCYAAQTQGKPATLSCLFLCRTQARSLCLMCAGRLSWLRLLVHAVQQRWRSRRNDWSQKAIVEKDEDDDRRISGETRRSGAQDV